MRELNSLSLRSTKNLCHHLGCTPQEMERISRGTSRYYRRWEKNANGKRRPIAEPVGRLREMLDRLCRLLQRMRIPDCLHGGIRGRSPETNAFPHVGKAAVMRFDLKDFFPSVGPRTVYKLFRGNLGCSPDISHVLTKLVTLDGGLPQGSPTSTVVANLVVANLAKRLAALAQAHGADYTQFVDDGTFSGPGYLERLRPLIERIIREERLCPSPKPEKRVTRYWYQEQVATGVRVNRQIDIPRAKLLSTRAEVDRLVGIARRGGSVTGKQIHSITGKIRHVGRLNRGAGRTLMRRLRRGIGANPAMGR